MNGRNDRVPFVYPVSAASRGFLMVLREVKANLPGERLPVNT